MSRKMKDSGIEWINTIPEEWEIKKIKYTLENRNENNNPIKSRDILSLTAKQGVIPLEEKKSGGNKPKEDYSAYKLAYPGDIVMNSMNILSGSVGLSKYFGCVSPVYYMFRSSNKYDDVRYFNYIFQTTVFQKSLLGLGNGILMKKSDNGKLNTIRMRIPLDKFSNLYIPIPSSSEQQKIADFLDEKVSEIDNVIEKTKASIEEYKKYKQTIITETVTKGLNLEVEMKNSGIEWIGEIPKDWSIRKIKNIFYVYSGATPKSSVKEFWDGDIKWITPADYKTEDKYVFGGKRCISQSGYDSCGTTLVNANSIVFSKRAPIGTVAITKEKMCTNQGCLSCVNKKYQSIDYFYYLFSIATEVFEALGTGTTFKEISFDNFINMKVPVPQIDTQQEIVSFLDEKCNQINDLINKKEKFIEELEVYKKSLIYEYVTGKKEVI